MMLFRRSRTLTELRAGSLCMLFYQQTPVACTLAGAAAYRTLTPLSPAAERQLTRWLAGTYAQPMPQHVFDSAVIVMLTLQETCDAPTPALYADRETLPVSLLGV
jgi:hypothetical protein